MEPEKKIENRNVGKNKNKSLIWAEIEVDLKEIASGESTRTYSLFRNAEKTKISAKVPLLLPRRKYPMPRTLELDSAWLKDWLKASGVIRPGDSDDSILNRALDSCYGSVYMVPQGDPGSGLMQVFMKFFAIGLVVDDVVEESNMFARNKELIPLIPQIASDIIKGAFDKIEEVPFAYPAVRPILKAFFFSSESARNLIANFDERIKPFATATMDTLGGMCQLLQLDEDEISEETFKYLRRYEIGFEPFIELAALILGVDLEEDVRNSLLFRRILDLSCRIGSMVNDLIGIKKDILEGNSNLVLFKAKRHGGSIEEAYEEVAYLIGRDVDDLKNSCRQLKMANERNENVPEYLRILKQFLDGFIHWCSTNRSRYGQGWVRIEIMET